MKRRLALPRAVAVEIADVARRAGRSTGFLARRALVAAKGGAAAVPAGETALLELALDEDDDPKTLARVDELLAARGGDPAAALASAWLASRAQFLAWLERQESVDRAARADDLDAALAEAAGSATAPSRLDELSRHEYVQVRARVAKNPRAAEATLARLAAEPAKIIRDALRGNPSLPAPLRAKLE